jgi:transformation/transcription domain-associated protein
LTKDPAEIGGLSPTTETNLSRFADSMHPNHTKYKAAFEWDFIKTAPTLTQLVERFRNWRDRLEIMLDSRPRKQRLEHFSHYLVEFEYQKFDDIEVPGQYYLVWYF